jgi:DNA-binding MarR family transcriptional regulator
MEQRALIEFKTTLETALSSLSSIECKVEHAFADLRATEIRLRRARARFFPAGYFADVAWDILLELDHAERMGHSFSVTDVGVDTGIPLTTLLRYLAKLEADGFVTRAQDPMDGRRAMIGLTDQGRISLDQVFNATIEGAKPQIGSQLTNDVSTTLIA